MKFKLQFIPITLAVLLCSAARAYTPSKSYEDPKVLAGNIHIRSACIMPAEGKLTKVGMKGGEGMSKESDAWSSTLETVVENHLKAAGVQTLSASSALDSGASDDELHQVLLDVEQKYEAVAKQLDKKPKDIRKARYTLGDQVDLLPCSAKSDVLVFVEGQGEVLTGGKKAMGYLVTGQVDSMAMVILTIADAKTGDILAFVRMTNAEKFLTDSEKAYGAALDKQFKRMGIVGTAAGMH